MLDGAIHSACDTGKITPEQRDEFLSLMLAFDAFVEAAVPNKPSEFLYHSSSFESRTCRSTPSWAILTAARDK